jgi:transcriptional regulator with XRE-family HTH domain
MIDPKRPYAHEYVTLGRALRALRKRVGLTQVQAGEAIGVRGSFVSAIETGERGMRWHTLRAFLDAYNAKLSDLEREIERAESKRD